MRARRGVILGCGGFEHNEQMRVKTSVRRLEPTGRWVPRPTPEMAFWPPKSSAQLWISWRTLGGDLRCRWSALLVRLIRAQLPGSMIVNMAGRRFMNESMPYVEACHHMYGGQYGQGPGPGENVPAWLIFDQQYRDRYIFAGLQPGQRIPKKWLDSG